MKHFNTLFLVLWLLFEGQHIGAQAPERSEDVLLQGFYWNSQRETGWTQLLPWVDEIGKNFTGIWLPPSCNPEFGYTVGGTNVGYHPRIWNDQNSCWGTAEQLKTLNAAFHQRGVHVLADIVVNHRAGYTAYANFPVDDFGEFGSYQLTLADVCSNDEVNTAADAAEFRRLYGMATGAEDTGTNWDGSRDLDHTSSNVQADIEAYLRWMKAEMGYDGWRYDLVKGYHGRYVAQYNTASQPWLSVGECFDESYDVCKAWLAAANYQSLAFDFPAKLRALKALSQGNYADMSWMEQETGVWRPAGLIHHASTDRYAVTFVDNHDTYRESDKKFTGDVLQGYAFILSAPGIPCVFWPHWAQSNTNRSMINKQISVRHIAGVHSQSKCTVTARTTYYECQTVGEKGTLICRIGTRNTMPTDVPEGYFLACGASNWAFYLPLALQDVFTGLSAPATAPEPAASGLRDLQGRPVREMSVPGVYIMDGRKVLK